jgi:hypothetical protein
MVDRVARRATGGDTADSRAWTDGGTPAGQGKGPDEKYCSNCGERIAVEAETCPACGVRQGHQRSRPAPYGRWKAAGIGGFLGFVTLLIPLVNLFSPFVGGLVAGSLRGSDTTESALTGALASVVASVPLVVFGGLFFLLATLGVVSDPAMGAGEAALGLAVWFGIFAVAFGLFYAVGAACGALGAALSGRGEPE